MQIKILCYNTSPPLQGEVINLYHHWQCLMRSFLCRILIPTKYELFLLHNREWEQNWYLGLDLVLFVWKPTILKLSSCMQSLVLWILCLPCYVIPCLKFTGMINQNSLFYDNPTSHLSPMKDVIINLKNGGMV